MYAECCEERRASAVSLIEKGKKKTWVCERARHEEVRIKEGEIVWRFQSLCRNVITAFFIGPEASRTVSSILSASRACVHFIARSLRALHLQISTFFTYCHAMCTLAQPKISQCSLARPLARSLVIYFP